MEKPDNSSSAHPVCRRLRALRFRHFGPRSKRKLASLLGIPLSTYCTYEENRQPPPDLLVKAAKLTGCDLEWLLTGELGPLATDRLTPDESAIVKRLARIISGRPEALPAVQALIDLLSQSPDAAAIFPDQKALSPPGLQAPAGQTETAGQAKLLMDDSEMTTVPVIGRAAAGHVAFWHGLAGEPLVPDLKALATEALAADATRTFGGQFTVGGRPARGRTDAQIVQFAEPKEVGHALIDGILIVPAARIAANAVAVQVDGESMADVLHNGDYVIVDPERRAATGQIALVMIHGQIGGTCKVYIEEEELIRLVPENPEFESVTVPRQSVLFAWQVIGVVRHPQ